MPAKPSHGADVVTAAQQGSRKGMPHGMRRGWLRDAGNLHRALEITLESLVIQMMAAHHTRAWIDRMPALREHPRPSQRMTDVWILALQRVGRRHPATISRVVGGTQRSGPNQLLAQGRSQALGGSIRARSLAPLPSRTMIAACSKSTSLTRSCRHSLMRMPVPYGSGANNRRSPSAIPGILATSSGVSTTSKRRVGRGRAISFIDGRGPRTAPSRRRTTRQRAPADGSRSKRGARSQATTRSLRPQCHPKLPDAAGRETEGTRKPNGHKPARFVCCRAYTERARAIGPGP